MLNNSAFANSLDKYKWLMVLWTIATLLSVLSNAMMVTQVLFGVVAFILAATMVLASSISSAYVIARDAMD